MANAVINPKDNPVFEAGVQAERKRLHEAFRQIAARYQWDSSQRQPEHPEITIRRAIDEVFEEPLGWVDPEEFKKRK